MILMKKIIKKFKKLSQKQKIITILGILFLVFLGTKLLPQKEESISYKTEEVKKTSVVSIVSETGEILTSGKVDVNSSIKGLVQEVYVQNGDPVKSGQALFKVESSASFEERASAYSSYLTAKSSLESAETGLHSLQSAAFSANQVLINDAVARELDETDPTYIQQKADWLAAEANYINQTTSINQKKAGLNSAWLSYQSVTSGTVKAPIGGAVANLALSPGQEVDITDLALMIQNESDSWAKLAVSEGDIGQIASGQKAMIYPDALDGLKIEGVVDRVDEIGTEISGIVTYNVYLNLGQIEKSTKPGMTVQIDIETQKAEDVLSVSNSAIKTYQGSKAVQIVDEKTGQPLYLPVEVGITGDIKTQIIKGLSEGDEVIVGQSSDTEASDERSGMFPMGGRIIH